MLSDSMKERSDASERDGERIGAVILAAGASSRLGTPKQLLEYGGRTLVRRAALAAHEAGCNPVVVVTGAHAEKLEEELHGLNVREANNPEWESGIGSSIRAGIQAVIKANDKVTALVLMLCDQRCSVGHSSRNLFGLKAELVRHLTQVHLLPFPQGEVDLDTPADFARLLSSSKS
jgi:CTP:molybdopterin cytidylyltransferase MocA